MYKLLYTCDLTCTPNRQIIPEYKMHAGYYYHNQYQQVACKGAGQLWLISQCSERPQPLAPIQSEQIVAFGPSRRTLPQKVLPEPTIAFSPKQTRADLISSPNQHLAASLKAKPQPTRADLIAESDHSLQPQSNQSRLQHLAPADVPYLKRYYQSRPQPLVPSRLEPTLSAARIGIYLQASKPDLSLEPSSMTLALSPAASSSTLAFSTSASNQTKA